jgi:hypothetical protein
MFGAGADNPKPQWQEHIGAFGLESIDREAITAERLPAPIRESRRMQRVRGTACLASEMLHAAPVICLNQETTDDAAWICRPDDKPSG